MTTLLRVLVVEDSEDDAQLELRQLRSGGYDLKWERVETAEAMSSALDREQWDLILCDYRMPNFNAPAALKLLQDKGMDIPFIIVSGTVGEDTAVDAMKAGAHDYLMKDKLAKLVVAVEREMREAKIRCEKKKSEEALSISEMRYRRLFEAAQDGVLILDAETGMVVDVNPFLIELLDYSHEEFIGKTIWELGTLKDVISNLDNFLELQQRGYARYEDLPLETNGGRHINVEFISNVYLVGHKKVIQCNIRDITERKRTEEAAAAALRKSEERFRIAAESTSDCVWERDFKKASVDWFGDIASLLGYRRDEFPGTIDAWENAVHPEDHDRVMALLDKHIADHTPYDAKYRVVKKDGSIAFWVDRGTALLDENGKAYRMIGAVKDITESKRADEKLRESEKKFREMAELLPEVVFECDIQGNLTFVNRIAFEQFGYTQEDFDKGVTAFQFIAPGDRKRVEETLGKVLRGTQKGTSEYIALRKDGSEFPSIVYSAPIIHNGRPVGLRGIITDITESKRAEEDLVKYKDHLEELVKERTAELDKAKSIAETANKAKSDFLANMSHEIRTPLSSIIGFSELLYDEVSGPLNDNQKKYLGYITSSGQHLLSLINDILDLSKVEAGKMELLPTSFSMSDLLKTSFTFIAEKALKHNIKLLSEISSDVDIIEADERKVKQIIYNLLSNAVKFTPDGGTITIGADIISSDFADVPIKMRKGLSDTEYVLVSVKDTGIGIAKKDQSKLFTEFQQIEEPYSKKYEGTGLGLALSKRLVTLHGGKIWFESKGKGKGCIFYFILPLKTLPKA